jgi:hypothetical protein
MGRNQEVDAWFERYDNPMKEVVQRVRAIVGAQIRGKHPRLEGTGATSRVMKIGRVAEAGAEKPKARRPAKRSR